MLDLVFVSDNFSTDSASIETVDGILDHRIVLCTLPLSAPIRQPGTVKYVLSFNKADDAAIMTYLSHAYPDFSDLCTDSNASIDEVWAQFKHHIIYCISNFIPTRKQVTKNTTHGLTVT